MSNTKGPRQTRPMNRQLIVQPEYFSEVQGALLERQNIYAGIDFNFLEKWQGGGCGGGCGGAAEGAQGLKVNTGLSEGQISVCSTHVAFAAPRSGSGEPSVLRGGLVFSHGHGRHMHTPPMYT